jgi:hypothetical protein
MAAYGEITLPWADGDYAFRLGFRQIGEFEEKFDGSFLAYCQRLAGGDAKFNEIREIIRLGLIGGGMEPAKALSLVKGYVEERPPSESLAIAILIARSGAFGSASYHEKKKTKQKRSRKNTSASTSEISSELPAPLE